MTELRIAPQGPPARPITRPYKPRKAQIARSQRIHHLVARYGSPLKFFFEMMAGVPLKYRNPYKNGAWETYFPTMEDRKWGAEKAAPYVEAVMGPHDAEETAKAAGLTIQIVNFSGDKAAVTVEGAQSSPMIDVTPAQEEVREPQERS